MLSTDEIISARVGFDSPMMTPSNRLNRKRENIGFEAHMVEHSSFIKNSLMGNSGEVSALQTGDLLIENLR